LAHRIIDRQPALVLQLQDRSGGELFRHRGQTETGVQLQRLIVLVVRLAIDLTEQDLIALGHQDGAHELFVFAQVIQPRLQLRQGLDHLHRRSLGQPGLAGRRRLGLRRDGVDDPGAGAGGGQGDRGQGSEEPGPTASRLGNYKHDTELRS